VAREVALKRRPRFRARIHPIRIMEPHVKRLFTLVALFACAAAASAEPTGVVRRTTLVVHDIDASIRFYRDVLGFEVWLENRGKVGPSSLPVELPPGSPSRFAIMKGRHPWVGMVGLLQYGPARALPEPPAVVRPGDAVLMIETSEVEAIFGRMQAAGVKVLRAPETSEVTGADGGKWEANFLFAYDPDGHLLEINERRPRVPAAQGGAASERRASVRRDFADTRFGQLHFRRASPSQPVGARAPVVLLHQTPLSGRMFAELLAPLARDRVVYALDTPGYGESDPPPKPPTIGDYADAMHDFIAELKEPVDLVGYHTGALIAAEIALRHPQSVRRLVLISVPVMSAERRAKLGTETPLSEDGSHLAESWRSSMSVKPEGQSLEQVARIVAEKQRAGQRSGWGMVAVKQYDAEKRLSQLEQPTTILRPKDSLWDDGAAAAKLIRGAALVDLPEWSYGIFDAYPEEIAGLVREALDGAVVPAEPGGR
jgi:pimeloyl-ACP methyl ester carboxylesterase